VKSVAKSSVETPSEDIGRRFSFGVICLLIFCFVALSQKIQIGDVAAMAAVLAAITREGPLVLPKNVFCYAAYLLLGALGLITTRYFDMAAKSFMDVLGLLLIAFALTNILSGGAETRAFAIGYLALYAAYPIRGLYYNFILGISTEGRFSWNFFFSNPNDLAIANFLPLGLCGYLICTHKGIIKSAAITGVIMMIGALFLTQSRGAMLGMLVATAYLVLASSSKGKVVVWLAAVVLAAALLAPRGVWDRLSNLRGASVTTGMNLDVKDDSAEERWTIMGVGINIAANHWLLGTGIGTYGAAHNSATLNRNDLVSGARGPRDAHCLYIRSAAETGMLGLVSIVFFMAFPIAYAIRTRRSAAAKGVSARVVLAILILEASMIAYAIAGIFASGERSTFFVLQYLLPFALISSMARQYGLNENAAARLPILRRARSLARP
jgi:O-antigen ligase